MKINNNWIEKRTLVINAYKYLNQDIVAVGFLRKTRKLGKICFATLADQSGEIQLVFNENNLNQILKLNKESIILIFGILQSRKAPNLNILNGEYEIMVKECVVLSHAQITPFVIEKNINATEATRLTYRYLDLRSQIGDNLKLRSKITNYLRSFLLENNFYEIETPYLSRITPEGARDFLVPIRTKNKPLAFALPQSPQLYKQLLMIGGLEKYFQIARCFRDEDLRADRQYEFSQLDIELAYSSTEQLINLMELMLKNLWKKFFNKELKTPFLKLSYKDCINNYGSDKPDLRFDIKIEKLSNFFNHNVNPIFLDSGNTNNDILGIFIPDVNINKKHYQTMLEITINFNIKNILYSSNMEKELHGNFIEVAKNEIYQYFNTKKNKGSLILLQGGSEKIQFALGAIRQWVGNEFKLINYEEDLFLWVVDWPLFEYDFQNNKYSAMHHPFTSPQQEFLFNFDIDKKNALADAYDLVLNGSEIAGGSKRIYDMDIQKKMFDAIGLSKNEIENKFGWFIKAFEFGVPPHQGIAFGLDRLIQIMLKANSIRDVIAFPKSVKGNDLLLQAPNFLEQEQLNELNLEIKKDK